MPGSLSGAAIAGARLPWCERHVFRAGSAGEAAGATDRAQTVRLGVGMGGTKSALWDEPRGRGLEWLTTGAAPGQVRGASGAACRLVRVPVALRQRAPSLTPSRCSRAAGFSVVMELVAGPLSGGVACEVGEALSRVNWRPVPTARPPKPPGRDRIAGAVRTGLLAGGVALALRSREGAFCHGWGARSWRS